MTNQAYWTGRATDLEASLHRSAEQVAEDLDRAYRVAERQIDADISRWYQRFADNNGIVDMAEARRLLNSRELKEFKWTVQDYIRHGRENGVTADWSKELENASARFHVSRLEAIRYQMQNAVEVLYGNQLDGLDSLLKNTYLEGYGRAAWTVQTGLGIGFDIAGINDRALKTVLYRPWSADGRNFSDRIWENKQALVNELHKQLTQNIMRGGNVNDVISAIEQKFGTSRSNAARLVYTENAYAVSVATGDGYRATGVEKVLFIATLDERTSQICQSMDGTIIDMKDYSPGVTVPPLHPYCRSTTAPYFADMAGIGERIARDEEGKTYYVPRDMKYPEWHDTFMKDPESGEAGSKEGLKEVAPGGILTLADCKSTADVENLMKQQGWFRTTTINDKVYNTNEAVSLAGCDLDIAKGVYEALDDIYRRFPELVGKLNSIATADLDGMTYAQCSIGIGHGGVTLNKKWFANVAKISTSYAKDLAGGFHPAGTDWKSIVSHEFGHAIDDYLSNTLYAAGMNSWRAKYISADLRPKVMRACGLKVHQAGSAVSGYATKDHYEWFAECFGEGMNSTAPRPVAAELMKRLTEIIRTVVK